MGKQSHRARGAPHDAFFRNTFLNLGRARPLLRHLLPEDQARALDWRTLRLCTSRFSDRRLVQAETDLLFEVRFRRRRKTMFILVEHKSSPWWRCVFDLLRYVVHFWERWLDANPHARVVPPIIALVVHHGRHGWTCAESLQELIDLRGLPGTTAAAMRAWLPELRFLLQDLSRLDPTKLRSMPLPAIVKVRLLAMQPGRNLSPATAAQALEQNRDLVQQVLRSPGGRAAMEPVWSYLTKVSELPPAALARTIARISPTAETSFMSTYNRILKIGKAEGKAEALLRQLRKRFGRLSDQLVARVRRASPVELDLWGMRILDASTLQAVFGVRRRGRTTTSARRPAAGSRR